jgi:hypothetical protein
MPCVIETSVSEDLLALVSGDGKRIVAVMEAFIDESGTYKDASIVNVAAWVGAHWQWKKFLSYWDDRYFHARDPKCAPLKQALFEAIGFGELRGFTAWMEPKNYADHATAHFRSALGNPYSVCAFACAMGVCKFCKRDNLGKVAFVIEDGQPNVEFVRETLEFMKCKERFGIASIAIASKKDFVQLCTADFLAHSRSSNGRWFDALYDTERVYQDHVTPERVVRMSRQLTEGIKRMKRERKLLKTLTSEGE